MADIIPLNPHARRGVQTNVRKPDAGAIIVIFPGVRYERAATDGLIDDGSRPVGKPRRAGRERSKTRA